MNTNKLLASAVVFVFTNFIFPTAAAEEVKVQKIPSEVPASKAPEVELGVPRVVNVQTDTIIIRSVNPHHTLLRQLQSRPFLFDHGKVTVTVHTYGSEQAGFVSLSTADLETGLIQIQRPQNALEKNVAGILANPDQYNVRGDLVSTQMEPKIISDAKAAGHLLAMEAWDFRLTSGAHYNTTSINQMFLNAYSTFKAYKQICQKQNPGKSVVIHTSYWGTEYRNSARITTAIQLIAAELAGIDRLVFHINPTGHEDAQALFEAQDFVAQQSGESLGTILANVLKKTAQPGWQAGVSGMVAKAGSSFDSSLVANE